MSKLFPKSDGRCISNDGLVHEYHTWMTEPDETNQVTECDQYLFSLEDWNYVEPGSLVTCLSCIGQPRKRHFRNRTGLCP